MNPDLPDEEDEPDELEIRFVSVTWRNDGSGLVVDGSGDDDERIALLHRGLFALVDPRTEIDPS